MPTDSLACSVQHRAAVSWAAMCTNEQSCLKPSQAHRTSSSSSGLKSFVIWKYCRRQQECPSEDRRQHAGSDNHCCTQAMCLHTPAESLQGSCLQQEMQASQTTLKMPCPEWSHGQGVGRAQEGELKHCPLPVAQSPMGFSPLMMFATVVAHRSLHPQKYGHSSQISTR